MWSTTKLFHLLVTLLLSEKVLANGCGFCAGGNVRNPSTLVAISSKDDVHTCLAWQQISSLTQDLTDDACRFISPFLEAICGCDKAPVYDQCDLCGSSLLAFQSPTKGLVIPNSNGKQILCQTIYSAVQKGAVPPSDCKILKGITDFCGGCVTATNQGLEFLEPASSRFVDMPAEAPVAETIASFPSNAGLTEQPTIGEFVGSIARFPTTDGGATIAEAAVETAKPSSTPTGAPSTSPTTSAPSPGPTVAHSSAPTSEPTLTPSESPTITSSAEPTVTHSSAPTSSPTEAPSEGPTVAHSMAPTVESSSNPTITGSSSPTYTPTTTASAGPSAAVSSAPSEGPTMLLLVENNFAEAATIQSTTTPTATYSGAPTSTKTMQLSTVPSIEATAKATNAPSVTSMARESELTTLEPTSRTCDLCPGGTLEDPSRLTSLINMDDKTVTKTCGALLWDARSGRNEIDRSACNFLKPFFGATCGCSTFTPFPTANKENPDYNKCNLCDKPNDVFQDPFKALRIPGSARTKITCGGVFLGGVNGATSETECRVLSTIDEHCGGCGIANSTFYGKVEPPTKCVDCQGENESSMYIYKDFGTSGTTFQKALSAPFHCNDKRKPGKTQDCSKLLYPELESCVLAPVTSFDELIRIQAVIPSGKAAYTAVRKDPLVLRTEARECYTTNEYHGIEGVEVQLSRSRTANGKNCALDNWREGLAYGYDEDYESKQRLSTLTNITANAVSDPCESMKSGWTNYKTGTDVPSNVWNTGKLNYCNLGPVQEIGAVWAVEPDGNNYGDLRDVSQNWPLPGAVYKCCKTIYSCFEQ